MNYTNFGLEKNVEILSAHHVERFTQLRENEQYQDADAVIEDLELDERFYHKPVAPKVQP